MSLSAAWGLHPVCLLLILGVFDHFSFGPSASRLSFFSALPLPSSVLSWRSWLPASTFLYGTSLGWASRIGIAINNSIVLVDFNG